RGIVSQRRYAFCRTMGDELIDVRSVHDGIIVRRLEEGEQQSGVIIIHDKAKEKPQRGTVIAAGSGTVKAGGTRVPLDVKAGDVNLFRKYTSQERKHAREQYDIQREAEDAAGRETDRRKRH